MSSEDDRDEKPKRSRRKPVEQPDADEKTGSEPRRPRQKTASKAERAEEPPVSQPRRRTPAEKFAPGTKKKREAGPSQKQAESSDDKKAPPVGRISRALWFARMVIRYAPVWILVVLLLLIFGPALLRALRISIRNPGVAPLFTPEVQYWKPQILRWSQEYDVDPNLIATLMQIESCGLPGAASQVGAQGLFQVMPLHFDPAENMTDPETNARRGIGVIRDCLNWANNDVGLALACYNGGPRLISLPPSEWPTESQRYYTWGGGIFNDAQRGASHSDTLDAWLASGGIYLCQQAAVALGMSTPEPPSVPSIVPTTPVPVLPTVAVVEPGQAVPLPTLAGLPTFALPTVVAPVR
jgi:soluble lytic murein transglycosylase-like protein